MRITGLRLAERVRSFARATVSFFKKPTVRRNTLRILSSLLAVLLIVFCVYHFTRMPDSEIETMLATEDTVKTTVTGEGVLFREEVFVGGSNGGLLCPLVASGEHVAKDTELAAVYASGSEQQEYYRYLSEYIDRLSLAESESDALADLASLEGDIRALALRTVALLENGSGSEAALLMEELRVLYSRVEALKSESFTVKALVETLKNARAELVAKAGEAFETLTSHEGGYYYPYADGHGALCTPSRLESLTGSELLSIKDTVRSGGDAAVGGVLVPDAEWSIAIPTDLSADELALLTVGATYPVVFLDEGELEIPMTLTRTVEGGEETPALLVLATLRMPEGFSFDRLQNVRVVTGETTGFSIPSAAIHRLNGLPGVYVLEGNVMVFCRVEILRDLGARALVKTTDPTPDTEYTSNTYRYVARYDAIILSGTDLFHGRVFS